MHDNLTIRHTAGLVCWEGGGGGGGGGGRSRPRGMGSCTHARQGGYMLIPRVVLPTTFSSLSSPPLSLSFRRPRCYAAFDAGRTVYSQGLPGREPGAPRVALFGTRRHAVGGGGGGAAILAADQLRLQLQQTLIPVLEIRLKARCETLLQYYCNRQAAAAAPAATAPSTGHPGPAPAHGGGDGGGGDSGAVTRQLAHAEALQLCDIVRQDQQRVGALRSRLSMAEAAVMTGPPCSLDLGLI